MTSRHRTRLAAADAGFTATEMLVVLMIIAMTASVGLVAFNTRSEPGIGRQAETVRALFREAANTAQALRRDVEVQIDIDEKSLTLVSFDRTIQLTTDLALQLETGRSLVSGASTGAIVFSPDGRSTGGRLTLDNGKEKALSITIHWLTSSVEIER